MIQSKDKVVNFRVTHQEYVAYCRACRAAGLTNLSEMARAAMRQYVHQKISGPAVSEQSAVGISGAAPAHL